MGIERRGRPRRAVPMNCAAKGANGPYVARAAAPNAREGLSLGLDRVRRTPIDVVTRDEFLCDARLGVVGAGAVVGVRPRVTRGVVRTDDADGRGASFEIGVVACAARRVHA